ncbi:type II secretion system minor pseudopilin [Crateriforma conspicua]|uniref:General secretion pathway protein K n=1 Tax=Crateriforma conspicua TaxID=2527996 RepID=A0A5C5Y5S6_9PLAN|nr:type II secretion system protein GspK [Crateriforma conspicua]TWT70278.1 General secretion pathway protein K [Crateriforma conspicua]
MIAGSNDGPTESINSFRKVSTAKRPAFFLVLALIVVTVATLACYSFTELMVAYDDSAYLSADIVQTRVNTESGIEAIRLLLAQPKETRTDFGGIYNNPNMFQAITVSTGADGTTASNFSVIATDLDETGRYGGIRFGLRDESAKLNVNTLPILDQYSDAIMALVPVDDSSTEVLSDSVAVNLLMALPGMTEDVAEAILDWIDEDDEARELGVESEYYNTLTTPYDAANGPLQSVEELLLIRGVTPTLLFGADANRNGVLDADEQQRFGVGIETAGALGWAAYLTVHGVESNRREDGSDRVNVNQDDLELLYDQLLDALGDESYASYIVAYRISGQSDNESDVENLNAALGIDADTAQQTADENDAGGGPSQPWASEALDELDLSGGGSNQLGQVLDLIGSTVSIGQGDSAVTYQSPFAEDPISMALYMPLLMDALTTQDSYVTPGRINLNECPAELLYGIPLLDSETVDLILEYRAEETDDVNRHFETWPLVAGLITLDQMKILQPLLTGGGDVYSAQIVGYFENSGAFHRTDVVIDATTVNPKIVAQRDLSHLGRGFDLTTLGIRGLATAATQ